MQNQTANNNPDDQRLNSEIARRRTFAIISHPDAGKTTMTEKLLLYGGAIRLAGSVKSRKANRYAVSDWMEIEKTRGISVTSSAMQFEYGGFIINILDTPGHQDFSEDTFRTLMAADCAVMLIDGGNGVEAQTVKLFQVCRMRKIPIITFINKLDRAIKDPFELMGEIEDVLGIKSCPMNWPIGIDGDFKGVYDRDTASVSVYSGGNHGQTIVESSSGDANDPVFAGLLGQYHHERLLSEIELIDVAGDPFDMDKILNGKLTPVFFGSAMNNFGVEPFLKRFLTLAPPPSVKSANIGDIDPSGQSFSGFVFKIQANMNPSHRDRLAFVRICSGRFSRNMEVYHGNNLIRLTQPRQFMANDYTIIEEAFPGDIIGLYDPGIFHIGDTLSEYGPDLSFEAIPSFSPEHFIRISPVDSMKRKQFIKGISQLSEEGAVQMFRLPGAGMESVIIGAVGILQFEVLEFRLRTEYNVELRRTALPYRIAKWRGKRSDIVEDGKSGENAGPKPNAPLQLQRPIDLDTEELQLTSSSLIVNDSEGFPVILFENQWSVDWALEKNKGLTLRDTNSRVD